VARCPYCGAEVSRLFFEKRILYTVKLTENRLIYSEKGREATYRCPNCWSVIARSEEEAERFLRTHEKLTRLIRESEEPKTKVDNVEQKTAQIRQQAQTQTAQQVYNPEKLTLKQKILKFGQEFVSFVTFTSLAKEELERIEVLDKLIQFYRGNQNIILSQKQLQIARDYFDPEKLAWKKKILKFAVAFAPHAGVTPLVKQELKRIEELEKLLQESIKNQNVNQPQNQTQPRA